MNIRHWVGNKIICPINIPFKFKISGMSVECHLLLGILRLINLSYVPDRVCPSSAQKNVDDNHVKHYDLK